MCKCTPSIRTSYCGKVGCEWPKIPKKTFNVHQGGRINTYDCDGVVFINKDVVGVYPGPRDIIITGRSFEEKPETEAMLFERRIFNLVIYNNLKYDEKTRGSSGEHKAMTIKSLQRAGYTVVAHYEDDEVQAKVITEACPEVHVVMLVHDLTNKENCRHTEF